RLAEHGLHRIAPHGPDRPDAATRPFTHTGHSAPGRHATCAGATGDPQPVDVMFGVVMGTRGARLTSRRPAASRGLSPAWAGGMRRRPGRQNTHLAIIAQR